MIHAARQLPLSCPALAAFPSAASSSSARRGWRQSSKQGMIVLGRRGLEPSDALHSKALERGSLHQEAYALCDQND